VQQNETQFYLQLSVLLDCLATILFDSVMFRHFMWQRSNLTEAYSKYFLFLRASSQIMNNGSLPYVFNFSSFLLSTKTRLWLFRVKKYFEDCCREDFELVEWRGNLTGLIELKVRFRSQWSRGLRRQSAASCFLGLWVRIPRRHRCLCFLWLLCRQAEVSASGWSLVQRSPTECGVSECDCEALA
jgi:hypothetical protein